MINTFTSESELSVQQEIFNTLLRTPHRSVDEVLSIHLAQLQRDPYLYGCLATYAVYHGECAVRDVQDVFLATMFISEFPEHREAAWRMLQDFPPHRVVRVIKYITGYTEVVKHTSQSKPMPAQDRFGLSYERMKYSSNHSDPLKRGKEIPSVVQKIGNSLRRQINASDCEITIDTYCVRHKCHNRSLNRVAKSAIKNYLRWRELDKNRPMMEGAIIRMHKHIKTLYATCHLLPENDENGWINGVLFRNEVPRGSRIEAMKKVSQSNDPAEQAKLIMDAKLPFPVVQSLVKTVTPSVLIALIDAMSPQELLANLAKIKREGAFNDPSIKGLVQAKILSLKKTKRGKMDAFKGSIAADAVQGLDEETKALVEGVTDAQLKLHGKISIPTVLCIDKSGSMADAIELGKKVAATLAQAGGSNFKKCYLFSDTATPIIFDKSDGDITSFSAWQKKLKMQRAGGCTRMGSCLSAMIRSNVDVEQIVIVTDEGDNGTPRFSVVLGEYEKKFGHMPNIVIIRLGRYAVDKVERGCKHAGATVDVINVENIDEISLPNLVRLCSRKSIFDLIQEILELPLPMKKDWHSKHPEMKLEMVGSAV